MNIMNIVSFVCRPFALTKSKSTKSMAAALAATTIDEAPAATINTTKINTSQMACSIKAKIAANPSNVQTIENRKMRTMRAAMAKRMNGNNRNTNENSSHTKCNRNGKNIENRSNFNRLWLNCNGFDFYYYYYCLVKIIAIITVATITTCNIAVTDAQLSVGGGGGGGGGDVDGDVHISDLTHLLKRCTLDSDEFDSCMKDVFNDLRPYFPTGIPYYNIQPFDPHRASFIEIRRGYQNGLGGFKLILRNVSEYGWKHSEVTKFQSDFDNQRITYSQYFPEKSLEGQYEFNAKMIGQPIKRKGFWNMTLYDYSQTTSVRRLGGPGALLKVHVEVDQLGGLKMHISDFLSAGQQQFDILTDGVINTMWPIGFPFIKPLINELVSRAFTDIFNESFRYFPIQNFVH